KNIIRKKEFLKNNRRPDSEDLSGNKLNDYQNCTNYHSLDLQNEKLTRGIHVLDNEPCSSTGQINLSTSICDEASSLPLELPNLDSTDSDSIIVTQKPFKLPSLVNLFEAAEAQRIELEENASGSIDPLSLTHHREMDGAQALNPDSSEGKNKGIASSILRSGKLSYKSSGVDIEAGDSLVSIIKPLVASTTRTGVLGSIGSFGGLFDTKAAGYKDPILVSGTDGVGTKLKTAISCGKHNSVGIDLVAMCVNDVLAHGAEPLFFLDYFVCGRLDINTAAEVISGVVEDLVIGLPSSGVHRNGFSLVRKILKLAEKSFNDIAPFSVNGKTIGAELLEPTKIYTK
ncbi:hypothetical protein PV328_012356, partial [Microctonus aethiopoides]